MPSYEEIIQTAIDRQKKALGADSAISHAREIDGLEVSDEGEVEGLSRDGADVLADLLEEYQAVGGPVSLSLVARALKEKYGDELDEVELPGAVTSRI